MPDDAKLPDHTSREIDRQPALLDQAMELSLTTLAAPVMDRARTPVLVGCGTSYYLALAGAARMRERTGSPAIALPAGDLWLWPDRELAPWQAPILIAISRSGTTTEVVRAAQAARDRGVPVIAVTTVPDSTLSATADHVIALPDAAERSIVMTGSFTSMLLVLERLAAERAGQMLPATQLAAFAAAHMDDLRARAGEVVATGPSRYVFLGAGADHALALEGMLKMKEMTQIDSQAFASLEFRHGPISVLDEHTVVVLLHRGQDFERDLASDLVARGASVAAIGPGSLGAAVTWTVDLPDELPGVLAMPFLQWLAYEQAIALDKDPDAPHGLTQVVEL